MEYTEWAAIGRQMAILVISDDLKDLMIPTDEAKLKAAQALSRGSNQALDVEYRMLQALSALEMLGYVITKKE